MKNNNIIIFSSSTSEKNGLLNNIQTGLSLKGYNCSIWRNLFSHARNMNHVALLPTLIKKIPTFDYAILICEGHDLTTIRRDSKTLQVKSMRDNVLFEIGLCTMALGLKRTILVTDSYVHLPDDLIGLNDTIALKQFILSDFEQIVHEIDDYIKQTGDVLHQVIIGAASSTACGYISNFIFRILEHINDDINFSYAGKTFSMKVPLNKVFLDIVLPSNITPDILESLRKESRNLTQGCIYTARNRPVYFSCTFQNNELHIIDYPTNIVTSYDTAKIILNMDADDTLDYNAEQRFTTKELNLYESTLKSLLTPEFAAQVVEEHYPSFSENNKRKLMEQITDVICNRLSILHR